MIALSGLVDACVKGDARTPPSVQRYFALIPHFILIMGCSLPKVCSSIHKSSNTCKWSSASVQTDEVVRNIVRNDIYSSV